MGAQGIPLASLEPVQGAQKASLEPVQGAQKPWQGAQIPFEFDLNPWKKLPPFYVESQK